MSASRQRYVADELTHFVGRGRSEAEQYALLVEVLRTGRLRPDPPLADPPGDLLVDLARPLSGNDAYRPDAVCLCDIPLGDLDIHIRKYSPFGVAFRKAVLVERGASPMFYVAARSRTRAPGADGADGARTRAERFDEAARGYHSLQQEALARLAEGDAPAREREFLERFLRLADFLDFEVFSYAKFFDSPAPDEDPSNHYMEREWRVLGEVRFSLDEVTRVVLPSRYARRLREDVPEYAGQVVFGEPA